VHSKFAAPKALSLDLDDTLLDWRGIENSVARTCEFISNVLTGFTSSEVLEANATAFRDYWPTIEEQWTLGLVDSASVGQEIWRRTLSACGCTDQVILQSALTKDERFSREVNVLYDDVQILLSFAFDHNLRLALVTNGPSDLQRWKLQSLGLEDNFDAVAISGEIGVAKPDPLPFQKVVEELDANPRDVWHIGDSLSNDVAGARAAGLVSVWLNRLGRVPDESEPIPDIEVASLSNLVEILGTVLSRRV
jgi:putative hydrolase of the HAD superfamily